LIGVAPERLSFRLSIHETADVSAALRFWAGVVGVEADHFHKTNLKRHNPRTVRHNTGESYAGCLIVSVSRSTELHRRIEGWWKGLIGALDSLRSDQ